MRALATLGALAVLAPAAPAAADPLPAGRVAVVIGAKTGTGALASSIGLGYALGFEAGYGAMSRNQRVGWGASWSTIWSDFRGGSARVADSLAMVELDAGLRVRIALGVRKRQVLFLGGGGALVRTNEPLFEGGARTHVGPWGGAGVEGTLGAGYLLTATLRYGVIRDGQGTLGLLISIGAGR